MRDIHKTSAAAILYILMELRTAI